MKHINALNKMAMFAARMKGAALSFDDVVALRKMFKRAQHRATRLSGYFRHNARFINNPGYAPPRGLHHPSIDLPRRLNPLHWTGKAWVACRV